MLNDELITSLSWIYAGAALVATVALFSRQSVIVAYILLGVLFGPYGLKIVQNPEISSEIGHVGMIFLLFLAGLHLDPKNLLYTLSKAVSVTLATSSIFSVLCFLILYYGFGFSMQDSSIVGAAMMFSSTLIGLKLLPNDLLHGEPIGEVIISILLIQDLLAIIAMVVLNSLGKEDIGHDQLIMLVLAIPFLLAYGFILERYFISKLFNVFESVREYLFILSVGWCLSLSELASVLNLSREVGAFIAGVTIASGSVSTYLAECLSPLRDFFLVLFFFSMGASLNLSLLYNVLLPTMALVVVMVVIKPMMYWLFLDRTMEDDPIGWEVGVRLGQASEFSILVGQIAYYAKLISAEASVLITAVVIASFVISTYWVSLSFVTPMARIKRNED